MTLLTIKLSDGSRSPPQGSYCEEPTEEVAMPSAISSIQMHTFNDNSGGFSLYRMVVESETEEKTVDLMPDDGRKWHRSTETVSLRPCERIVAAKIEVNKETGKYKTCVACKIAFMIYEGGR